MIYNNNGRRFVMKFLQIVTILKHVYKIIMIIIITGVGNNNLRYPRAAHFICRNEIHAINIRQRSLCANMT